MDIVSQWLKKEFANKKTRATYKAGIRKFVAMISGIKKRHAKKTSQEIRQEEQRMYNKQINRWMKNYLENDPDIIDDIKLFISELRTQGAPYKTIHTYVAAIKLFMADHGHYIREEIWKKISKRQLPPSIPLTHDRAPTRKELTDILRYLDIKGRTGSRRKNDTRNHSNTIYERG